MIGLSIVDGVRANAASWNGLTMDPLVIHPRLPPAELWWLELLHRMIQAINTFRFVFRVLLCHSVEGLALL